MEEFLNFLKTSYFTLLPLAGSGLFGYLVWVLKENRKADRAKELRHQELVTAQEVKDKALISGTVSILRYIIRRLHNEFMMQQYVTENQLHEFLEYVDAYTTLGGNGVVPKMVEEVKELPIDNSRSELSIYAKMYYDACKEANEKEPKSKD